MIFMWYIRYYMIYIYIYVLSNLQQHLTTLCTFHEHSGRHLAISNCKGSTLRQGEDCQLLHAGIADPSKLPEKSSNQSEPSMGGMRAGCPNCTGMKTHPEYVLSNLQQHLTTLCTFHEHSGRHLAISNCKGSTLRQGEDCQLLPHRNS